MTIYPPRLIQKPTFISTLTVLCLTLTAGCSAPHQANKKKSLKELQVNEKRTEEEMVGPPSLLALSEGAVDAEFEDEAAERVAPRVKMFKKRGRPITVIELWFNAGVIYERGQERGSSWVFQEQFEDRLERGGGADSLKAIGAMVKTSLTLDRLIVHVEVENELCLRALASLSAVFREVREGLGIRSALERSKNRRVPKTWIGHRLSSRLTIESLNRVNETHQEAISSPLINSEEFKPLTEERVKSFIYDMTEPSDVELLIVGDFDASQIQEAASTLFAFSEQEQSSTKASTRSVSSSSSMKKKQDSRDLLSVDVEPIDTKISSIEIAIPLRDLSPEEAGYLDLIGFVLVGDQNGVMHQEAERANLELKGSSVRNIVTDKGSVFLLKIYVPSNQVNEGWHFLLEQLGSLIHQPISQRNLERAKSIFERENLLIGESLSGQARRLGHFSTHWPKSEALKRYGRAVYRVRPITLLKFMQRHFQQPTPRALIAGPPPTGAELSMWRERLSEQLDEAMTQRKDTPLLGFSTHGSQLSVLLVPSESDGVSSMIITLPLKRLEEVARYYRSTHMALAHWFTALVSSKIPNEPKIEAYFDDRSLILHSTFPSRQIGEVFTTLMRRLRQPPLSSESQWQPNLLEKARQRALTELTLSHKNPQKKLRYLTRRALSAFTKVTYPLPKERGEALSRLSSSELSRWYRQHIQTEPMYAVITGDVEEVQLGRSLSPLKTNKLSNSLEKALYKAPTDRTSQPMLSRCRSVKLIADHDEGWLSLSYPIPLSSEMSDVRLLESAIIHLSSKRGEEPYAHIDRDHHTSPHLFSIFVDGPAKVFNKRWAMIKGLISELKERPVSTEVLEELKRHAKRIRAQEISRTRTYAELHSEAWFRGWQIDGGLKESDWESELERFTTARLQEVAKSIFNDQRLIYSNILPPYVELSPSSKCQNVTP